MPVHGELFRALRSCACIADPGGLEGRHVLENAQGCFHQAHGKGRPRSLAQPKIQLKKRFLIHGGSSGIGTTAIQLASLFGARVFATAGSAEKCAACTDLGAERAINYRDEDFVEVLRAEGGADLILDMVGGDYIPRNIKALADDGRLVQIAFLSGPKAELNFAQVMVRRLTITGSTLRPQSDLAKARIAEGLSEHVWPYLENGRVAPVMDSEFPLEEAAAAHARMESSQHIGKIVLKVG